MTNKERLMAALFDNTGREHADIKFLFDGGMDITDEDLCGDAVDMLDQMDKGTGDKIFAEAFTQREASAFIASV